MIRAAHNPNVGPGPNDFIDSYLVNDDKYSDNRGSNVRVGSDVTSDTPANNGGASYYPGVNLLGVFQASYANSNDANRNCYVDPVIVGLPGVVRE